MKVAIDRERHEGDIVAYEEAVGKLENHFELHIGCNMQCPTYLAIREYVLHLKAELIHKAED
jgi:hypothetical protein